MEQTIKQKRITPRGRLLLLALFAAQPVLDILSYWTAALQLPELIPTALRAMLLVAFGLAGFLLSDRKKWYLLGAGIAAIALIGHIAACVQAGYQDPVSDLTNFIRVLQLPLFAACLATCLRRYRGCARIIEQGLILNFWIITVSVLLSLITGTASSTYDLSGVGVIGWFATTNAQSSILSMLVPIVILLHYRKRILPLFALVALVGFAQLYFIGTRLAFLTIPFTFAGLVITALITRNVDRKYLILLGLLCAVCLITVKQSPMYRNQSHYNASMESKQGDSARMIREGVTLPKDLTPVAPEDEPETVDEETLEMIYEFYATELCDRFGTERVMARYDYTRDISAITATRQVKINYCKMLMQELPPLTRVFGIELDRMHYNGLNYDPENDFHGIYFLYGPVGLGMLLLFFGYFVWMIVHALLRRFRTVFTLEAGAFGMAFLMAMVYAYYTAGLLRRPNASFYLSVVLAYIYYLVRLRRYGNEAA